MTKAELEKEIEHLNERLGELNGEVGYYRQQLTEICDQHEKEVKGLQESFNDNVDYALCISLQRKLANLTAKNASISAELDYYHNKGESGPQKEINELKDIIIELNRRMLK